MAAGLQMNKKHQFNIGYLLMVFFAVTLFQMWLGSRS